MLAKRHSKAILGLLPLVLLSLTGCGKPDPPGDGTLSLNVADWVPAFEHEGQWRVVPVGGASEDSVTSTDPNATIELPAGRYDVYWIQGYQQEDDPMLLASGVAVETGDETVVAANSGIHVDQADWVPTFGHEGWWGAVPTGKALSDRVDWTDDDFDLLLPPGTYDVYWVQDYHHAKAPMLLGRDLLVEQGKRTSLDGGSGIHLDLAEWIPEFGHEGWWGAVPTGKALSDRVDWSDGDSNLLLPPGNYDVYWVQDYHHAKDPMRLARDLRVESGKTTSLDARSGIHLNQADWVPALGHEGWWGAVPTGKALSNRVDWSIGAKHLLLPPGNYDVYWVQDYNHAKAPMRLARDVLVEAGEVRRVDASSGIRLDLAEAVPDIGHNGWWGAVPAGKNVAERIDWSVAKDAPLLLPAGTYDVYWKQDSNSEATRIHEAVVVHLGQLIEVVAEVSSSPDG